MPNIQILNLTPVGRYANGVPFYNFHNPFPYNGFNILPEKFSSPEDAFSNGKNFVSKYERDTFPGGMGACLGVAKINDCYQAVISTCYSNS